ncbi:hypothetical protein KKC65_02845 [Patescibacteria group bacterium]|nr:hypothetical protein [Patescibacteria group bacterium]
MNIIQEAKKYAISEKEKFGTPSLVHFEIVEKKATELAEKLNADKKIALVGVYLMDLKLGQALKEDRLSEHVAMSVEASKEFLNGFDIDDTEKDKIINCVEAHHKDIPFKYIEAEICANADCYKFIHPKGFFSYLTVLGKRYPNFEDSLNQAEKKLEEKYKILSLDVCKNELEYFYEAIRDLIKKARNL